MIKLIDILREVLDEAKQVGKIYHFTSYKNMIEIIRGGFHLKSGFMKMGPNYTSDREYVSFTRNKSFKSDSVYVQVRITIDGDKLSNKYKIEPYSDLKGGYGRSHNNDESEERVKIDIRKYPNGIDIRSYILSIDLKSDSEYADDDNILTYYNDLKSSLKRNHIDYNIIDRF